MPEKELSITTVHYPIDRDMGPKLASLSPRRQAFVIAMLETGQDNHTLCAKMAGYTGTEKSIRVQAFRLAHDDKIQAALTEQAQRRMKTGAIMATGTLLSIASNPVHKDQLKAAVEILNRTGLHAKTEQVVTHEHTINDKAMIAKIVELARGLGMEPKKLLGQYGVTVDAEFEEVKTITTESALPARDEDDEVDGTEGLEDLL